MFAKSPNQKYQDYLDYFTVQVADPANWDALRADRECTNWACPEEAPVPLMRGEALFRMGDPKKMAKAVLNKREQRRLHYAELSQYVNGDPKQGKLNPEYLARFENTEKLRQMLKNYSGSPEAASDLLFKMKKEADEAGQDFSHYALTQIDQMKGNHVIPTEPEPIETIPPVEPVKKSLASQLKHFLWKKGLPIQSFTQKELDVDVANQIGKDDSC